jgi:hydrogenase maturation protease
MQISSDQKKILVLGIGNYLMGDEGIGIHAVRYLQQHSLPAQVTLTDGGTGGFHLLPWLEAYDPVIIIDATLGDAPPGTVRITRPRYASEFPRTLGAHDIGLKDLIESASLLEKLPEIWLVTIAIRPEPDLTTELSPALRDTLPLIEEEVLYILKQIR